jgi:hypothetical protein
MYTAAVLLPLFKDRVPGLPDASYQMLAEAVAEFSREVAEIEREACAKVVESGRHLHEDAPSAQWARQVAALIRSRKG